MRADIKAGLDRAFTGAYLEALAGTSTLTGPFARVEGGATLWRRLALFAFGNWTPAESTAGVGARVKL